MCLSLTDDFTLIWVIHNPRKNKKPYQIYFNLLYHLRWTCGSERENLFEEFSVIISQKQHIWEFQTEEMTPLKILFNF